MRVIFKTIIYTFLFMAIAQVFPQYFTLADVQTAVIASFVIVILNMTAKPILQLISLPITILTLGLFTIVINASILEFVSTFLDGKFKFTSFGAAMLVAVIMSIVNLIIGNRAKN
ncbi:phage holin family protein [Lactobacillus sp. YT155]|uniref:phage holin family protein n=1 Tax=Lactobacillus sp. YT155 TaxID=3060955 RepID=UPI00265E1071|nr:phage holin family protein [Lactobacillus sp. YT155]MDO1605117.1 phage holin family protein [Lactobacillus sp. YT155]